MLQVMSSKCLPVSQAGVTANLPQPPFPQLLQSNAPPTDSEISLLRGVITIAKEESSRLKEMMSSHTGSDHQVTQVTPETATNLTRELGRTHQFIIEHNSILSSIRHIPPEILQNIFIHTLPTMTTPGSRMRSNSQLPWALSQVCQLWRTIMLSFSVMWRDLPIVDLSEGYTKEKRFLDLLTELLKRSHNMPICLTIGRGSNRDVAHPAIDMLVLHSDRWQEIKISGEFSLLSAFKLIKGHLSSLQSLHLDFCIYDGDPVHYTVHDLFQTAPQLRHVDFYGPPSQQLLFPTHQLVHYSQNGAHLEQVMQTILSSPLSLRTLRFHVHPDTTPVANSLPTVAQLPNLINLNANFYKFLTDHQSFSTIYEPFFNNITTPALEQLIVKNGTENTIKPIRSMILRSGCLLKVLFLQVQFAPGELQSVLRLTPLVTKLSIAFPPAQDILALMFDGNSPPLLPLLKDCEFLKRHDYSDFSPSMEAIQALNLLASSRCELPDNITSAETLLSSEFHPLQTLRISIQWTSIRYRQYFEGWADSHMANELYKLHRRLLDTIPELDRGFIPPSRNCDLEWQNEVTGLLTHLETLEIDKASDICISGIQYILYAISVWFVAFSFSLIAKRILEKWEPVLRVNMPNLRWHTTGFYLKYLSTTENRALCSSPDALKFFYYGLDSNITADRYVAFYGMMADYMGLLG